MTRFKILSMASAVAAAFVVSTAPAQQTTRPDSSKDVQQRDATGNPSGSPTQPPRSTASDPTMRSGSARSDRSVTRTDAPSPHGQYGSGTVRDVQQALQDKGYDVGPVDGVIGPRTQSALRQFQQQQQGIPSSGRLDSQTLGALNVSSAGMSDRSGVTGSSSSSGRMGDRSAGATGRASTGAVGTGNPGSGTIGTSPSGAATPPASGTMGSGGIASETPRSSGRASGPARTGNPGSGTIGSSPSGTGTPPASSTTGSSSGRTGG
jgi:hypothetical protein